jgi:hypothetical protein
MLVLWKNAGGQIREENGVISPIPPIFREIEDICGVIRQNRWELALFCTVWWRIRP